MMHIKPIKTHFVFIWNVHKKKYKFLICHFICSSHHNHKLKSTKRFYMCQVSEKFIMPKHYNGSFACQSVRLNVHDIRNCVCLALVWRTKREPMKIIQKKTKQVKENNFIESQNCAVIQLSLTLIFYIYNQKSMKFLINSN